MFSPDEREITDSLVTLLDDMIIVMRTAVRVISHQSLETYVKMMANVDTICDIQKVIVNSVEFDTVKVTMLEKVKIDFKSA